MLETKDKQADAAREEYLAEVSRRLTGRLAALEIYESIQEMRTHIDAMAAAYQELGLDHSTAMGAALEKFGAPIHIGNLVAGAERERVRLQPSIGLFLTMCVSSVLGAWLLLLCDEWLLLNGRMIFGLGPDVLAGAIAGCVAGTVAWFTRLKAYQFGAAAGLGLIVVLHFTLRRFYVDIGREYGYSMVAQSVCASIFLLATISVLVARRFQKSGSTIASD